MTDSLLSRLQALTVPSREIDAEIALANGWKKPSFKSGETYWRSPDGDIRPQPPRFTEDTDTARMLLPKGAQWELGSGSDGGFMATIYVDTGTDVAVIESFDAATPAIALLIAITKAKESLRAPPSEDKT